MIMEGLTYDCFKPIRYLNMRFNLLKYDMGKQFTSLLSVSTVNSIYKPHWDKLKDEQEVLLWNSPAFVDRVPSLPRYIKGWLLISDRGLYFYCNRKRGIKSYFRCYSTPLWKWDVVNGLPRCSFYMASGEIWTFHMIRRIDLFRSVLFKYERRN